MQIPNRQVYKMIEKLEYIAYHPTIDEQARDNAKSIIDYLSTNFKSKPNYARHKTLH